jgi:hypothetical protein
MFRIPIFRDQLSRQILVAIRCDIFYDIKSPRSREWGAMQRFARIYKLTVLTYLFRHFFRFL